MSYYQGFPLEDLPDDFFFSDEPLSHFILRVGSNNSMNEVFGSFNMCDQDGLLNSGPVFSQLSPNVRKGLFQQKYEENSNLNQIKKQNVSFEHGNSSDIIILERPQGILGEKTKEDKTAEIEEEIIQKDSQAHLLAPVPQSNVTSPQFLQPPSCPIRQSALYKVNISEENMMLLIRLIYKIQSDPAYTVKQKQTLIRQVRSFGTPEKSRKPRISTQAKQKVIELFRLGVTSFTVIAKKCQVNRHSVKRILKQEKLIPHNQ